MERSDCLFRLEQRNKILQALLSAIKEKPLDKISIEDICHASGISRSSFYRCFSSIKDITIWYCTYCALLGRDQIGRTLTIAEGHAVSLGLMREASPLYMHLFHNWDYNFSLPAVNLHINSMEEVLQEKGIEINTALTYSLDAIARVCHRLVEQWFNRNCDLPLEELVTIIVSFYPEDLREIFDNPPQHLTPAQVASHVLGAVF